MTAVLPLTRPTAVQHMRKLPRVAVVGICVSLLVTAVVGVRLFSLTNLASPAAQARARITHQLYRSGAVKRPVKFMIHQTYKTCDPAKLPPHWAGTPAAWKKAFPEATYRCWEDAELRELIARKAPWFLPTYDGYPYNIQRVDSSRYFLLHEYGGLYADMDIRPYDNVTDIIRNAFQPVRHRTVMPEHQAVEVVTENEEEEYLEAVLFPSTFQAWWLPPSGRITNAIMIAPRPQSKFFAEVINGLQASYQTTYNVFYYMYILTSAGSRYVNLQYLDASEQRPEGVGLVDVEVSRTRLQHVEGNSWHQKDVFGKIADQVRPMIVK